MVTDHVFHEQTELNKCTVNGHKNLQEQGISGQGVSLNYYPFELNNLSEPRN